MYKNGVTFELNDAVEDAFREHFGNNAAFPTFLFHWVHALQEKVSVRKIISTPPESVENT